MSLDALFIEKLIHKDNFFQLLKNFETINIFWNKTFKKLICTIGTNVIFLEKNLDKHTLRMVYGGWLLTGVREGEEGTVA